MTCTGAFGFDITHSKLLGFVQHSFTLNPRALLYLAVGLAVYAVIELVEAVGLWLGQRWGEYFAMVATGFAPCNWIGLSSSLWPLWRFGVRLFARERQGCGRLRDVPVGARSW